MRLHLFLTVALDPVSVMQLGVDKVTNSNIPRQGRGWMKGKRGRRGGGQSVMETRAAR